MKLVFSLVSIFIKLSLDMLSIKFERRSHSCGILMDRDWKFLKLT